MAKFSAGDRVTYFDGTVNHTDDTGTVLRMSDDGKGLLIRWDNGLSDACECADHAQGISKPDCTGEWFGVRDVRHAASAE